MNRQELRNEIAALEDRARAKRNTLDVNDPMREAFAEIARLAQIVRQEIVK